MSDLRTFLNDLYQLHKASKDLEHGVKRDNWTLFEPSKFIYAFFAFNSFYSIDWDTSSANQDITKWEYIKNTDSNLSETQKINKLIKFVHDSLLGKNTPQYSIEQKKQVSLIIADRLNSNVNISIENTKEILSTITVDPRINEYRKEKFIEDIEHLLNHNLNGKQLTDALSNVLYFVFIVRNNIFHGSKTVLEMMNHNQRDRLNIYSQILLAFNDLLFDAIENRFEWTRKQVDEDFRRVSASNESRTIRNFNSQSLANKLNIDIPEGSLFYPCCGNDTELPIKFFHENIIDYHFVDNYLVPQLPLLECTIEGYQDQTIDNRNSKRTSCPISKAIVHKVISSEPINHDISKENIDELSRLGIKCVGYKFQPSMILKQEWYLNSGIKKLNIYRHLQDGLATFTTLDKISVFFLRRDSDGEGGSGQRWFQKSVFDLILDKIVDGGLIVTDGSSLDYKLVDSAEWKGFWNNRNIRPNSIVENPADFYYNNIKFECLGKVANGYGPVYAWRVIKQTDK